MEYDNDWVLRDTDIKKDPPALNPSSLLRGSREPGWDKDATHIWMDPTIPQI